MTGQQVGLVQDFTAVFGWGGTDFVWDNRRLFEMRINLLSLFSIRGLFGLEKYCNYCEMPEVTHLQAESTGRAWIMFSLTSSLIDVWSQPFMSLSHASVVNLHCESVSITFRGLEHTVSVVQELKEGGTQDCYPGGKNETRLHWSSRVLFLRKIIFFL